MSESWRADALCAETDPELFFPTPEHSRVADAKKICDACDVTAKCLAYALAHNMNTGIWGGLSAIERARLKRDAA